MGFSYSRFRDGLMSRSKNLSYIFSGITLFLVVGVLGYIIYREREILFSYDWKVNLTALGLTVAIYSFSILQASFNWGNIMNRLAGKQSYFKHFRNFSIANAAKRLPGTVWYIASRATLYQQDGIDLKLTSMASALEYALVTISGALATLIFSLSILAKYQVSPFLLGLLLALTLSLIHPRVIGAIFRILKVEADTLKIKDIFLWTASYFLQWIVGGVLLFTVINIIFPLSIQQISYVLGVWFVVIMVSRLLIFLPSNMGVTEIGLSLLLSTLMPPSIAVVAAVLFRVLVTFLDILFASACVTLPWKRIGEIIKKD